MRRLLCTFFLLLPLLLGAGTRPNILWIISDDLGPELACYGYPEVATPNLDRLAAEGARFTHAFSTAPVCSSSRTAFQTGHYQTTVGGHHHNTRDKRVLPDSLPTVTKLMQEAGYFVSNGRGRAVAEKKIAKSHFNFVYKSAEFFDGFDWTQRAKDQPFFATVQIKEPHRAFVKANRKYPNAPIPPCYPDHPVTRADWANYLASIEVLDQKVGEILNRLEAEGLADNTLVIFFGDHGRPHVRGKQWLYDGGLHTPLILRWPGKIAPGTVDTRLVSLLDLMPTTLAAVGAKVPDLPGGNLLDTNWSGHEQLFAARDRCGDAPDRIRSVRTRDFKYIRNFHPEIPYMQHSGYKKSSYPVETVMKVLHAQGRWDSPFMAKARPPEELYDLTADPHEMTNLAADPSHAATLAELRKALDVWIEETGDLGAVDESKTVDLEALKIEKWKSFEKIMKKRGLDPNLSDAAYLAWWEQELGVTSAPGTDFGELIFADDFERNESQETTEEIGRGWDSNSKKRAGGNKQVDLKDGAMHISLHETADHAVSVTHPAAFRDGSVELRFLLEDAKDSLGLNFADLKFQEVHAGHLFVAKISTSSVQLTDLKTGGMANKFYDLRKARKLTPAHQEELKTKTKKFPNKLETGKWHHLRLDIEGETLSASIDGKKIGSFTSKGIAHPTKRTLRLAVPRKAVVDDVKIYARSGAEKQQ